MIKSLVLALLLVGGAAMAADFNRPEVQVGDTWKIKTADGTSEVVVRKIDDGKVYLTSSGLPLVNTLDMNPVSLVTFVKGGSGQVMTQYLPYIPYFEFPLSTGKKWRNDGVQFYRGGITGKLKVAGEVMGEEKVTLPIGDFLAAKVVINFDNGYDRGAVTCWYVPELKRAGKCVSNFAPVASYEVVETNVWPPMKSASAGE